MSLKSGTNFAGKKECILSLSKDYLWLTLLVLLAAVLRLSVGIGGRSFWIDEMASFICISGSFDGLIAGMLEWPLYPPLYFLSMFCAMQWGQSEFWLRFPSLLFGILAVPLIYQLGKTCFGRNAGLLAALLLAINPYHVWYSQEFRMYSLITCLAAAIGYFFLRTLDSDDLKWWVGFVVASSLAYSTHYYTLLLPVAQFAFFVFQLRPYRLQFRKWVVAQFVAFLPLLPWLYLLSRQEMLAFGIAWIPTPTLLSPLLTLQGFTIGLSGQLTWLTGIALAIALLAVILGLIAPQSKTKSARLFLALWLVVPFVLVLIVSFWRVFYYHRYFIIVLPAYLTLMAAGAVHLRFKSLRAALVGALVAMTLLSFLGYPSLSTFPQQDWKAAAQYIRENEEPSDIIAVDGVLEMAAWRYYYEGEAETVMRITDSVTEARKDLDAIYRPDKRLWMIYEGGLDPDASGWLEKHEVYVIDRRAYAGLDMVLVGAENL